MGRKGRGTISVKGLQDQAAASLAQALERVRNTPICEDPRGEVSEAEVADARHAVATLRHSLVSLAALWDGRSPAPTPPVLESHLREVAAAGRALSTAASRCARSAGPTLHFWMRNLLASISEAAKQALASMGTLESRPDTLRRAVNLAMEACDAAERASWTNREVLARRLNGIVQLAEEARREVEELDLEPSPEDDYGCWDEVEGLASAQEEDQEGSDDDPGEVVVSRRDSITAKAILEVLSRAAEMLSLLRPLLEDQPQGLFDWMKWEVLIPKADHLVKSLGRQALLVYPPIDAGEVGQASRDVKARLMALEQAWDPMGLDALPSERFFAAHSAVEGALTELEKAWQMKYVCDKVAANMRKRSDAIAGWRLLPFC